MTPPHRNAGPRESALRPQHPCRHSSPRVSAQDDGLTPRSAPNRQQMVPRGRDRSHTETRELGEPASLGVRGGGSVPEALRQEQASRGRGGGLGPWGQAAAAPRQGSGVASPQGLLGHSERESADRRYHVGRREAEPSRLEAAAPAGRSGKQTPVAPPPLPPGPGPLPRPCWGEGGRAPGGGREEDARIRGAPRQTRGETSRVGTAYTSPGKKMSTGHCILIKHLSGFNFTDIKKKTAQAIWN